MNLQQFNHQCYAETNSFHDRSNYIRYYDEHYAPLVTKFVNGIPGTTEYIDDCEDLIAQYKRDYDGLAKHIAELQNIVNEWRGLRVI